MNKSILVIDTPENCERCPFCRGWNVCKIMKYLNREKIISIYTVDHQIFEANKPDWCPLQPMPEKKALCGRYPQPDGILSSYTAGYNACIDKILARHMDAERKNVENNKKGFYIPCKSWHAEYTSARNITNIVIGLYASSGGTNGEFEIIWDELGMRLRAYSDGWKVFNQMPELTALLDTISKRETEPTLEEFAAMLKELGYEDCTEYERSDI